MLKVSPSIPRLIKQRGIGLGLPLVLGALLTIFSLLLAPQTTAQQLAAVPLPQETAVVTSTIPLSSTEVETISSITESVASDSYSFSLTDLGYENDTTLASPSGRVEYAFRIPANWLIETTGLLELDLSYTYSQIQSENYPIQFGDLTITLNGQTLEVYSIEAPELNHLQLQIPLPAELLANPNRARHAIGLSFDAGFLCKTPHQAKLVVHPNSRIVLNYTPRPLELDLSRYPWPLFQQAFVPDQVRFVLPLTATQSNASDILAIAAKLGDLTGNRMAISVTTANLFLSPDPETVEEHLIVIGRPQDNTLIPYLNEVTELPVSLHQQQLALTSEGPVSLNRGETFTYTFKITNTLDERVQLSMLDPLPGYTELLDCDPTCTEEAGMVTWEGLTLNPDQALELSLTLKASEVLTGPVVENTVTLIEDELGPVNAETLTATVAVGLTESEFQQITSMVGDYFFTYNGLAVAKDDGIVQEVLSPWRDDRAILIVTGLSEAGVRKASQAMSSETRFPGMSGPVALVREALAPIEIRTRAIPSSDFMTFAELGYGDEIIRGGTVQVVNYSFDIPFGWRLTQEAVVDLYFNHSQLIDYQTSALTVLLNGQPLTSLSLSDETAQQGHLHLGLGDASIRTGQSNQLAVQVSMSLPGECTDPDTTQLWFLIEDSSSLYLDHEEEEGRHALELSDVPYPFSANPTLSDLMIGLPENPTNNEWVLAIRIAGMLGSSANGASMVPVALLGNDWPVESMDGYQIIAIGRPSRQMLLQEINGLLPQPFLPGSDQIDQRLDNVIFRLPPGLDLGYVQLIPSPWDESRAFMAITGTSDTGLAWAAETLAKTPWVLRRGNLALVKANGITTFDTRGLTQQGMATVMATAMPEMMAETVTSTPPAPSVEPSATTNLPVAAQSQSTGSQRPGWLFPLIGLSGLLIIGSFVIAFWQARRSTQ